MVEVVVEGGNEAEGDVAKRIETRADGIEAQLHTGARTARSMASLVDSSVPLVESAQRIANAPRPSLDAPSGEEHGCGGPVRCAAAGMLSWS